MRVMLDLELQCTPDAAWRAIRSPDVFQAVSRPFTTFESLEPDGYPESWPEGDHPVRGRAFGALPMGDQLIALSFHEPEPGVRSVVDAGRGLSGGLRIVSRWRHEMRVSASAKREGAKREGATHFTDVLEFSAGIATPIMWIVYSVFWQWRAFRLKRLAPTWR